MTTAADMLAVGIPSPAILLTGPIICDGVATADTTAMESGSPVRMILLVYREPSGCLPLRSPPQNTEGLCCQ